MSQQLSSSFKKRVYITAEQKRELCLSKQTKPQPKNYELAKKYNISTSQVSDILKESNKWLEINPNSYQAKLKKVHTSPVANVEDALILWIQKALECNITITGNVIIIIFKIIKRKKILLLKIFLLILSIIISFQRI